MKYLKVWTSFRDVIKPLDDAEKGRLFDMMLLYAEDGTEPVDYVGNERFVWPAAKQWIDLTYAENARLHENGKKGGRPKTKQNQEKPTETNINQSEPTETKNNQDEPTKTHNIKESNVKESNVNESSKNILPLKRFMPPTVEDVQAYCDERGSWLIDPQSFIDYYETRGWMLTKNRKMVDWKAAVRTWENNEKERERKKKEENYDLPY